MGAMMRAIDWRRTPLGEIASWPHALRHAIAVMLSSQTAIAIAWGPELRLFYNDRFQPLLGDRHPDALGAPAAISGALAHLGEPALARLRRGEAVDLDDVYLPIDPCGTREDAWFGLACGPLRDDRGEVAGLLAIATETTRRVESERRLATLRALATACSAAARRVDQTAGAAAHALARDGIDAPFALIYAIADDGRSARLLARAGLPAPHAATPAAIDLTAGDATGWPIARATGAAVVIDDLAARFGALPATADREAPRSAIVLPLLRPGAARPHGALVAGINPRRALDEHYRGFFELAADRIAGALDPARCGDEPRRRDDAAAAELQRRTLHALFEQVPASIAIVRGDDLVFEMVNRCHRESTARGDVAGQRVFDVFPQLRGRGLEQMIALVQRTGEPCVVKEIEIDRRWWSFVLAPLADEHGAVDRVMSFSYDVSDLVIARQYAESATSRLQDTLELLETTLAGAPVGISVYDRELRLVQINDTLARWNGFDRERVLGQPLGELLPPDAAERVARRLRHVFATGATSEPLPLTATTRASPDQPRDWLVTYYPVRGPGGEVVQVGVVVVDVTHLPAELGAAAHPA